MKSKVHGKIFIAAFGMPFLLTPAFGQSFSERNQDQRCFQEREIPKFRATKKAVFKTGGGVSSSPAIMKYGAVVVGSDYGNVYFLNAPTKTGKTIIELVEVPRLPNGECPPKVEKKSEPSKAKAKVKPSNSSKGQ